MRASEEGTWNYGERFDVWTADEHGSARCDL